MMIFLNSKIGKDKSMVTDNLEDRQMLKVL